MGDPDSAARETISSKSSRASSGGDENPEDSDVLRLFAEELAVIRETAETGRVRITRVTRTREQPIDELLMRESIEVERVPVDRNVDAMPKVRDDGETMVIPVVEERFVVERQLVLKEELHIRRVRSSERVRETVTLRYQEAEVTRVPAQARAGADETAAGTASATTREKEP